MNQRIRNIYFNEILTFTCKQTLLKVYMYILYIQTKIILDAGYSLLPSDSREQLCVFNTMTEVKKETKKPLKV